MTTASVLLGALQRILDTRVLDRETHVCFRWLCAHDAITKSDLELYCLRRRQALLFHAIRTLGLYTEWSQQNPTAARYCTNDSWASLPTTAPGNPIAGSPMSRKANLRRVLNWWGIPPNTPVVRLSAEGANVHASFLPETSALRFVQRPFIRAPVVLAGTIAQITKFSEGADPSRVGWQPVSALMILDVCPASLLAQALPDQLLKQSKSKSVLRCLVDRSDALLGAECPEQKRIHLLTDIFHFDNLQTSEQPLDGHKPEFALLTDLDSRDVIRLREATNLELCIDTGTCGCGRPFPTLLGP